MTSTPELDWDADEGADLARLRELRQDLVGLGVPQDRVQLQALGLWGLEGEEDLDQTRVG